MNRRHFMKVSGGAAILSSAASAFGSVRGTKGAGADGAANVPAFPTLVISRTPPLRWEDAMISGNGPTGVMVMGLPLDDLVIVNHEKLWVVNSEYKPEAPDLRQTWAAARKIALEGRYRDADEFVAKEAGRIVREIYVGRGGKSARPWYDRTQPGFHLHVTTDSDGAPEQYRRETNLETGEISVSWTDVRGEWSRRIFVSRAHDVIVLELTAPEGSLVNATLRLSEAPGKLDGDVRTVTIDHDAAEMYFHAAYGRTMGRPKPEGYQALARVVIQGGRTRAVAGERVEIREAKSALMLMRFEYLDDAGAADRSALRAALAGLPGDYEALLAPHAALHGGMFRRVTLDLGGSREAPRPSDELIELASRGGGWPEFFETAHAVGRYALICCAGGELPPSLMGHWGDSWDAPWNGRYTFDANLNLAMAAVSQGNLPEMMESYAAFLERHLDDWRQNAAKLYGCRGIVTDLCQGWRHGIVLMETYPWTGGAGWLASYLYDHYLVTQDRAFLARHVVPLLREVADFYEDFLKGFPERNGRSVFYPSISPENEPVMTPADQTTNVVPNATGEIAICREALGNLIAACRDLGIENDSIPRWEALRAKLPDYLINKDGALAEWVYPGLGDEYHHRHSSHLYGVYPSLEISPDRTPKLHEAARVAIEKRLEAGLGGKMAHGFMHVSLIAARLKDAGLMERMLGEFARQRFLNSSFVSCHNPGPRIYNLDATFSLPAVLTEMLVYSEPGLVEALPALPQDRFERGTLRGLLARGGVTIEELHWNLAFGRIFLTLRSAREQSLIVRFGLNVRSVEADDPADRKRVMPKDKGSWRVGLPAGRSVRLRCGQ
jgi:hypothetical protein